jgi:tripartite-type tricarboxylate transporter receptor subunit TctC
MHGYRCLLLAVTALSAIASGGLARAETPAEFYKGRTVRVLAAFDAAGNAGLIVQAVALHLGTHLAGTPTVVPQFMPGGGGLVQANYIYNAAPKDGTVIGLLFDNLPTTQVLEPTGIKFDAKLFTIVGALNGGENGALAVRSDSKATTIAEAKQTEVVMAATGPGTTAYTISSALNKTIGTRFKLIMGYTSGGTMLHAFDQGEVTSLLLDYNSFVRDSPDMIKSGRMAWMLQIGDRPEPDLATVPMLQDVAETAEQRRIFMLLSESRRMGKAFIAPPGIPADRAAALRAAFQDMARDPAFVADAAKVGTKVQPRSWEAVAEVISSTVDTDPAIAAKASALIAPPN